MVNGEAGQPSTEGSGGEKGKKILMAMAATIARCFAKCGISNTCMA